MVNLVNLISNLANPINVALVIDVPAIKKRLLPYVLLQILVFAAFPEAQVAFSQGGDPGPKPVQIYHAFGNSITFGIGASIISDRYVSLIATDKALTLTDLGISGSQACDVVDAQIMPNEKSWRHECRCLYGDGRPQ